MAEEPPPRLRGRTVTARALLLGDRIDTAGLERREAISTAPLAIPSGNGLVVVFRYGVLVMIGLAARSESEVLGQVLPRVLGALDLREEEVMHVSATNQGEEGMGVDGILRVRALTPEKLMVIADTLAKSVALAQNERQIAEVFDTVEPFARQLAIGRSPRGRRAMIRLIGQALLVQQRLAGRVAVRDKPDILWDRPDLERLYGRLESEYELIERGEALARKLDLIEGTVTVVTDLIDTQRSLRLEVIVVALIFAEIALTLLQLMRGG